MRIALLLNPKSGSIGDPDALVAALRAPGHDVSVYAPDAADQVASSSPDRVVVAGGDGTIGGAFSAAAAAAVPLAVIPAGTANDFARALALPTDRDAAVALAAAPAPSILATWGGTVGGQPFVNVASVGLAVDAAERAEALKARLGPLAYGAGALHAGIVGRSVDARISVDGGEVATGPVFQLLVGASGRFGGGSGLGEAAPDDPQLVAAWVPAGSRLELPLRAIGLRRRTLEQQPGVQWWRGTEVEITATVGRRQAAWNVDGERWRPPAGPVRLAPLGPVAVIVAGEGSGTPPQ